MRQRLGKTGHFEFMVIFMNDSYVGFDKEIPFNFTIKEDDPNREVLEYDEDDVYAVKGPGIVQSLLDIAEDESDHEDENLTEIERLKQRLTKVGLENALEKGNES